MGLRNDGAGTHDFPTFAPRVASSTDFIASAKSRGEFFCLGQGALAGHLTCAIDSEDLPLYACSIQQLASLPLFGERASE
jgi:hypothetical protein